MSRRRRGKRTPAMVGFSIVALMGAAFAGIGLWQLGLARASESWPSTPGHVVSAEVERTTDSDGDVEYHAWSAWEGWPSAGQTSSDPGERSSSLTTQHL